VCEIEKETREVERAIHELRHRPDKTIPKDAVSKFITNDEDEYLLINDTSTAQFSTENKIKVAQKGQLIYGEAHFHQIYKDTGNGVYRLDVSSDDFKFCILCNPLVDDADPPVCMRMRGEPVIYEPCAACAYRSQIINTNHKLLKAAIECQRKVYNSRSAYFSAVQKFIGYQNSERKKLLFNRLRLDYHKEIFEPMYDDNKLPACRGDRRVCRADDVKKHITPKKGEFMHVFRHPTFAPYDNSSKNLLVVLIFDTLSVNTHYRYTVTRDPEEYFINLFYLTTPIDVLLREKAEKKASSDRRDSDQDRKGKEKIRRKRKNSNK
jgi:hypothetical protein